MKFGIVVFPGSNCERDLADAIRLHLKEEVVFCWHDQTLDDSELSTLDCLLLPGGFSYGDYLRSGALACLSPIMSSIRAFAQKGGPILGICNGFQILTEAHLLPGALVKNHSLQFQCESVGLIVENTRTPFTNAYQTKQSLRLPIAHADGNYIADPDVIEALEDNHQVVFRYEQEVNGSINRIAGICNPAGNIVGMMPHPERNLWVSAKGNLNGDGQGLFDSILQAGLQRIL